MSKLTRDDVLKLARLSRLQLSDEEIEKFRQEISLVLDYVETLNNVNTAGLEPTSQVTGLVNVTRPDKAVNYQAKPSELLKNARDVSQGQFKVKRVLQ